MKKYLEILKENVDQNIKIGRHNHIPDSEFDDEQLKMGIEVEKEHTDNLEIAKSIAKDHLIEDKIYYTKLKSLGL